MSIESTKSRLRNTPLHAECRKLELKLSFGYPVGIDLDLSLQDMHQSHSLHATLYRDVSDTSESQPRGCSDTKVSQD